MKKFWKIRNNSDIKLCMEYLHVEPNYIEILLEETSDFMKYLNKDPKPKCVYISVDDNERTYSVFGWFEDKDLSYMLSINYKYCGEINFRIEKLKKLNEQFR